ncbi:ROK family transcriptional regulator [Metabacillus sediminilitoris]|uniref:ROK family transcriptional regulator n=1 Tax=Metabacillus sediminilitoris TaxID=2567941 RepID=A0A4S4BII7_9BACI|nr:ROK family transcriptional regulator [Metabacillus sediminilitoris]QGQ45910.1 ROK family protein [Metabacillus sediminilitoris]THF74435.1 ROK family transcriptional regulator [Metabacillus sediminilitoris]
MSELISNPKNIKKVILRGIRTTLLERKSATKVELSEQLGISFPTISKFLSQMEKDGEIISVGLDDSSGGRRAKRYTYNSEYMLGLAIFLEGTGTNYTIFNCLGEVKVEGEAPSVLKEGGLDSLTKCIENLMMNYPKISSLAIGVPGAVDGGRIFYIPGYAQFQNFDLKGYYEDYFSIPVVVENDMNAAVLGYSNNRAIDKESLIYLYTGQNGPGAGIMINGDVVRGSTFFSGEVSFVPQYDNRNFGQALVNGSGHIKEDNEIDAISRLIASFVAIINPHTFIFSNDDIEKEVLNKITNGSAKYIPSEHLPELTMSDWKQDYLYGLQSLGLDLMMNKTK